MKALLQRVNSASVSVARKKITSIGKGLLVLLCVEQRDRHEHAVWLANKTAALRVFPSESREMERSVQDIGGAVLVVSQFTLAADVRKGNRPSFSAAAPPSYAEPLVDLFANSLRKQGIHVETGRFGADMQVSLVNDGPVTLLLHRV